MKNIRKKLLFAGAYLLTFIAAIVVTCMIENTGISSGGAKPTSMGMPSVYISYNGSLVNEMLAYTTAIDSGYLRDSITPLENNAGLSFGLRENGQTITAMKYTLTDAANEYTVDEGNSISEVASEGYRSYEINFKTPLVEGKEYCLAITLTNTDGQEYHYYTRVVQGLNYNTSDKLQFVWNFNRNTFDPEKTAVIKPYLENNGLNDNLSFANIDIYSNAASVMWGSMNPSAIGSVSTQIKSINDSSATIQLLYKVQVYDDNQNYKEYYVKEYYTIQWNTDRYHLKDFKRSMSEIPKNNSFAVGDKMLKLGVVDETTLDFTTKETQNGYVAAFVMDGRLWYYDVADNIATSVFSMNQGYSYQEFYGNYPYGIKTLKIEDDGSLYFIVYGYMSGGTHQGENGIGIFTYDTTQNLLEEKAFIPSIRGWEVLKMDIDKLAYMNDEHQMYLCLEDIVYRIDYESGQVRPVIEQLDINNYQLSNDGTMLAMPQSSKTPYAEGIDVYYLDSGKQETISGNGQAIQLLGFFENDIVYGTAESERIYDDVDGLTVVPMNKIYIADRDLNIIREYVPEGKYILDVKFSDTSLNLTLATASTVNGKTEYTITEGDYLVSKHTVSEEKVALTTVYDDVMRNEIYIKLPVTSLEKPIVQVSRQKDFEETIFNIDEQSASGEKYYLYIGDGLYRDYATIQEAVEACDKPTGSVVSENKQVVWQKSGKAAAARININEIEQGHAVQSITKTLCKFAENVENVTVDASMSLRQALAANMKEHRVISLKGMTLEDVLYFVSSNRPVVAKLRTDEFVVIVGYDADYLQIADPATGEVEDWNMKTYKTTFEQQGNVFLSYY